MHRKRTACFAVLVIALVAWLQHSTTTIAHAATGGYVALGDSYSSGVGADTDKNPFAVNLGNVNMSTYEPATVTNQCFRNNNAYPRLVAAQKSLPLKFVACSGATIADVFNGKSGEPSQLDALSADTSLVTLTVGGNDAGFMNVMGCIIGDIPSPSAVCSATDTRVTSAMTYISTVLPSRYDELIGAIKSRAPSAQIVMVGYSTTLPNQIYRDPLVTTSELQIALNLRGNLNAAIAQAATRNSVTYVDPFQSGSKFNDVTASSANLSNLSTTWGLRLLEFAFPNGWSSYHPTKRGQFLVSDLVLRVVHN